jgi:hypothetical protein
MFDVSFDALLDDLADRGLLAETLVVVVGEFGRTPRINKQGGRDHWGHVFSMALAGAGIGGGQAIGASDRNGAYPTTDPVQGGDLTATIFHLLGIDPHAEIRAEVAKLCGVQRFVFASTCSVYGACDETLDERSATRPVSHYGNTKLAAERVLLGMSDHRFAPTILRFATIYGLSGRTRFDLVVNLLTAKAKIDGKITVMGGNQWRPFVHVDDAALAVATALSAPLEIAGNEIFNVGSDVQNYTIKQVGEVVHEHVPGAELLVDEHDTDRRNYRVSFSKIYNQLNFQPQWTLEQGIQQVLEAIARGDIADYRDAKYSNVKFLSTQGTEHLRRSTWAHEMLKEITAG